MILVGLPLILIYIVKIVKKKEAKCIFYRKQEKVCRQSHQNQPYISHIPTISILYISL